jgi:hypothetical protein
MMSLVVFIVAVAVSMVLDRQERRHMLEKKFEYERLGWEMPRTRCRVSTLEAIFEILVGILLVLFGGLVLYAYYLISMIGESMGGEYYIGLFFALGIALVTVGRKGLRENQAYRINAKR